MKITVIGCGRWGSFIARYLSTIDHKVTLYGRAGSPRLRQFAENRRNDYMTLPEEVALSSGLDCVASCEVVVISVGSQSLRGLLQELAPHLTPGQIIVLCMKGIETQTCMRLSEVSEEILGDGYPVAVWLGPGHVQEFCRGVPNCMVIDSCNDAVKALLVREFSSELIRFYYRRDLIGNEIGAAAKNVIGIAAGMLDGVAKASLKGALMSRGTREVAKLISAAGGNELSAYGLCHLGDYEATVFSVHSHNRAFGEAFVRGEKYDKLAEGCYTVKALVKLAEKLNVELPICRAVYDLLYNGADTDEVLETLFKRNLTFEF